MPVWPENTARQTWRLSDRTRLKPWASPLKSGCSRRLRPKAEGHGTSLLVKDKAGIALATFVHDDTRTVRWNSSRPCVNGTSTLKFFQATISKPFRNLHAPLDCPSAAHGGLSPEEKVQWVQARSSSHVTMMVGDGFNDAAALAVADVASHGTGER